MNPNKIAYAHYDNYAPILTEANIFPYFLQRIRSLQRFSKEYRSGKAALAPVEVTHSIPMIQGEALVLAED